MIDFLKIKVTDADTIKYFKEHSSLYFHSESEALLFDKETITSKTTKQYKGALFEFTQHCLYILFKTRYFFNDKLHYANDFNVLNCIKTLKEFTEKKSAEVIQKEVEKLQNKEYVFVSQTSTQQAPPSQFDVGSDLTSDDLPF